MCRSFPVAQADEHWLRRTARTERRNGRAPSATTALTFISCAEEAEVIANCLLARVAKMLLPASAARVEAFKPTLTDSIRRLSVETPGSSRAQWRDELTTARAHLSEPETAR